MSKLNDCGGQEIFLPSSDCDDCSALEQRVRNLERLLEGVQRISFSKTDTNSSISGIFLGEVNNG